MAESEPELVPFDELDDDDDDRPRVRARKVPRWRKRAERKRAFRLTRPGPDGTVPLGGFWREPAPGPNPGAWHGRFQRQGDLELAVTIQLARWRRGWSQRDLGQEADLADGYVAELELGNRVPTTRTRLKLAAALDLDPAELGVVDNPDPGQLRAF
jgi:hypothetical protein